MGWAFGPKAEARSALPNSTITNPCCEEGLHEGARDVGRDTAPGFATRVLRCCAQACTHAQKEAALQAAVDGQVTQAAQGKEVVVRRRAVQGVLAVSWHCSGGGNLLR